MPKPNKFDGRRDASYNLSLQRLSMPPEVREPPHAMEHDDTEQGAPEEEVASF